MKSKVFAFYLLILVISCGKLPDYILSDSNPAINRTRKAKVLSCFFGLDNKMPLKSISIWGKAPVKDGIPVVFSHEISPSSVTKEAFEITKKDGTKTIPLFVTFKPSVEAFELRTILLIGEFGNENNNPPVSLKIVKNIVTRDGQNLLGQSIAITELKKGPFLSYSEYFNLENHYPYNAKRNGCDCPKEKTKMVVRTIWSGGVRAANGKELGKNELKKITVYVQSRETIIKVHPFQIADTNDNDNNIDLCIMETGIPILVEIVENTAIDPRNDPNLFTKVKVESRW